MLSRAINVTGVVQLIVILLFISLGPSARPKTSTNRKNDRAEAKTRSYIAQTVSKHRYVRPQKRERKQEKKEREREREVEGILSTWNRTLFCKRLQCCQSSYRYPVFTAGISDSWNFRFVETWVVRRIKGTRGHLFSLRSVIDWCTAFSKISPSRRSYQPVACSARLAIAVTC